MTRLLIALTLLTLVLTACSAGRESATTFEDPFAYCAAVGTIDQPDQRYVGPKTPVAIAKGLQQAFGVPASQPLQPFLRNTFWRCMGGKVYACNVGANIPCMERADLRQTPTQAMTDFCKASPNADVIPAYVTGRATVYLWGCKDGAPVIRRQVNSPDARGFLSKFWYRIEPS